MGVIASFGLFSGRTCLPSRPGDHPNVDLSETVGGRPPNANG